MSACRQCGWQLGRPLSAISLGDGEAPGTIAVIGRAQLLAYPTVTWLDARATEAPRIDDDTLPGDHTRCDPH